MITNLILVLMVAAMPAQSPEGKKVPADSVEVFSRGCLKGRVFTATAPAEDEGVTRGPDVMGRHFRVGGPREILDLVKKHNGQLVEVVGIVRKSALADEGIGLKAGRARVFIGGDPSRNPHTAPAGVPTIDLTALRHVSDRCPIR